MTVQTYIKTVRDGGLMLSTQFVNQIDSREKDSLNRSAIVWAFVLEGLKSIGLRDLPTLRKPVPPEVLKALALTIVGDYDSFQTTGLKGFSVSQPLEIRPLVLSVELGLGDNPSYAFKIRRLIGLGLDSLTRWPYNQGNQ